MNTVQNAYETMQQANRKVANGKCARTIPAAGKFAGRVPRRADRRRMGTLRKSLGVWTVAIAAMLSVPAATFGQLTTPALLEPLGLKMVGTGASGAATQGSSVAISGDGQTAVVGGMQDNSSIGAVWVYTHSGGAWSQQGAKLVGSGAAGGAGMGFAVAISYDGNTVAVGGLDDNGGVGAVWVFTRSAGTWTQQGNKLVGLGSTGTALQGESVALSADGNTLAEGGPTDNTNVGAVWVFARSGGVWTQQGDPLVGSGGVGGTNHGNAVALAGNGNTLFDGASGDNTQVGAVWVFTRTGGVWSQQGNKLVGSGATGAAAQGSAVAASGDGNTLVEGGAQDNSGTGGVWVFTRSGAVWTQQGSELLSNGASPGSLCGSSVALSRDGDVILAGVPQEGGSGGGAVAEFILSGGTWTQFGSQLGASDGDATANQGTAVGLSADGTTAIEGAPQDSSSTGAAWIFSTQTNFGASTLNSTITHTIVINAPGGFDDFGGFQVLLLGSSTADYQMSNTQPSSGACVFGAFYNTGTSCSVNVDFTPAAPGVRPGALLVYSDGSGGLGVVTATVYLTGVGQGPLLGVISGVINTVAGNGTAGYTGDGGAATSAELNGPFGLTLDGGDNLYISDYSNEVIREVNSNTDIISTIAGNGTAGFAGDTGPATSAELHQTEGLAVDGAGNLYIADTTNQVIRMVSATTGTITTVAGTGTHAGYTGDGGLATSAELYEPQAVVVDPNGNLYIGDSANNAVRKVNAAGVITTVAGGNGKGYSGDGGAATSAQLFGPLALAMDAAGDLFIDDDGNNVIRRVDGTTGIITTYAGAQSLSGGFSGDGGPATSAEMNDPEGIATDAAGNLYITDSSNNVVREVSSSLGTIFSIAGQGNPNVTGYTGDGGAATAALMNYPTYPALDGFGNLFISDAGNSVVRIVNGAAPLLFGTFAVGASSGAMSFTIANNGNAVLPLAGLSITGDFAFQSAAGACTTATVLNPGDTCVVSVVFTPTAGGVRTGFVAVGDPIVNLSGMAPPASTATALMASPNPAASGATVTFTVTITPAPTGSPLGTVYFCDAGTGSAVLRAGGARTTRPRLTACGSGTELGSAIPNASGVATFMTSSLAAGMHNVTAVYVGNAGFAPSTSSVVSEIINPGEATTTTALVSSLNPAGFGVSVTFTATVSPVPTAPTGSTVGSVYFCDAGSSPEVIASPHARAAGAGTARSGSALNSAIVRPHGGGSCGLGTLLDTVTPNGSGVATFVTSTLAVGVHNITAVYSGNAGFLTSTSNVVAETITSGTGTSTATTLVVSPNPAAVGATVTLTATVAPAPTGSPLGTVSFYDGATLLGTGTVSASGVATFTTAALSSGSHSITAVYSGNATFAASTSTAVTQTINGPVVTTETITASPNPAAVGQTVTFTVTISPAPTGTTLGTVVFCEPPGSAGDVKRSAGARSARAQAIWKRGAKEHPEGPDNGCGGGVFLANGTLNASGVATFSTSTLPVGSYAVFAFYSGNAGFSGAEGYVMGTINPLTTTTTTVSASPNPGGAGQGITFTATVAPLPTGSPLGTVNFYSGETLVGMGTVNASGVATFTTTAPTIVGTYTITAVYSGNAVFATSTSVGVSVSIIPAFGVTAPQTPFPVAQGGMVTVTVMVPSIGGPFNSPVTLSATGQPPGATVTFTPPMVTPGAAGTTTMMTVQLPKLIAGAPPAGVPSPPGRRVPVAPFGVAAFSALLFWWAFGKTRLVRAGLAAAAFAGTLLLFAGCNGGLAGGASTPAGMYVITVTGTSGALHASTSVTIVVSK